MTTASVGSAAERTAIRTCTPRARCWSCGSTKIVALCCRCHRFMCTGHDGVGDLSRLRDSLRLVRHRSAPPIEAESDDGPDVGAGDRDDVDHRDGDGNHSKARTVPAADPAPGSPKRTSERHFCRDCMPIGHAYDPEILTAVAILTFGALVSVWNYVLGGALAVIGAVRLAARVIAGERRRRMEQKRPTALFLDPRVTELAMTETLSGRADLAADNSYRCQVTDVHGEIDMKVVWARAHTEQVADYRRRHRIPDRQDLWISSGVLVVRGPARLTLHPGNGGRRVHPSTVLLEPATGDHPVLRTADGRGDPRWNFVIDYDLTPPERGWTVPVWLTPAISPGSDRRALDLEVQWRTHEPGDDTVAPEAALESKSIESLWISVPAAWGEVKSHSAAERVTVSVPFDGRRRIEWQEPTIKRSGRGHCHLSVSFERQIEPENAVRGELDMRFHRTLSEATTVQVHAAGGARRQDGARCTTSTRVKLAFDLNLGGLRYQDVRAVPDPVKDVGEKRKREHKTFARVVPDHHTVALLTNVLSSEGYYVKRVVENPPQPGRHAGVLNRFWDIAGRHYKGVHPVDFHLVVTGEEVEAGSSAEPTTTVRLAVRGTYATPELEQRIVREQELLWERVGGSLDSAEHGADGGVPREAEEPIDAASAELARVHSVAISLRDRLKIAQRSGDLTADLAAELISRINEEFRLGGPGG